LNADYRSYSRFLGPLLFVLLTFALTWASALVLYSDPIDGPITTIVLRASVIYVLAVGWQPFVAALIVRLTVDRLPSGHAHDGPSRRFIAIAMVLTMMLLVGAVIVKTALGPPRQNELDYPVEVTALDAGMSIVSFLGAIAVLWTQAIVEETTWRGYLLPRLMQALGPWAGIFVHGVLWGACYAPVFLVGESVAIASMVSFIVTCGLLGVLLGWLRLASGSIAPSAACNATLTICAGLPLVLQGLSPTLGAAFEPAGWLPMMLLVATIVTLPALRAVVVLRQPLVPDDVN